MTDVYHAEVSRLFREASRLGGHERAEFLDVACAGDTGLRAEVDALLEADADVNDDAFGADAGEGAAMLADAIARDDDSGESAGSHDWLPPAIGGYRIVRLIGRGGMGIVYEAEQETPRRRVAIKLLHPMLATSESLGRFRNEARTLGRLRHPGIAQIYESGTYDAGRGTQPFFAMELVDGSDVLTHVERTGADRARRLELLAKIADAVQYAHDQGVVHRDLKPDNVLMDEFGEPRVLDFGIARVKGTSETLSTIVTGEGDLVGTLAYMAPEQLEGDTAAITHRVDVYALGVLGFQLVVGRLPREIADLSLSQAITLLARSQTPRASAFDPTLKGDVDTILAKALESEAQRRYVSAAELAGDIRRHLAHHPIRAKPPSRVYLARKFARRHRGLVAGSVATMLALVIGLVVSLFFADSAREQRDLARANEMRAVNGLLQSAQILVDAERGRDASDQLRLVPEADRGFAWRMLDRATPNVLDINAGEWHFVDDEHLVGVPIDIATGEHNPFVAVYSLTTGRVTRRLFEGERIYRITSSDASGNVVATIVDHLSRGGRREVAYAILDLESGTVVDRRPVPLLTGELELPDGKTWISTPQGPVTRARYGEVSSDGRTVMHYVDGTTAVVYVDGDAVRTIDGLGMIEAAHIGRDGRVLVVNRRDQVVAYDIATRELLFQFSFAPDEWASGVPVHGGVLLHSGPDTGYLTNWSCTRAWARFDLTGDARPLRPKAPFESAFRSPHNRTHAAAYPLDGSFLVVAKEFFLDGAYLADATTGAPLEFPPLVTSRAGIRGWIPLEGKYVPMASPNGKRVVLASPVDGSHVFELDPRENVEGFDPRYVALRGHTDQAGNAGAGWVYQVAVSNDGSLVASIAPMDPFVRVWDARTGECVRKLERTISWNPGEGEELLAFTADDERLVGGLWLGRDPAIVTWSLTLQNDPTRAPVPELRGHQAYAQTMLDEFVAALDPEDRVRLSHRVQTLDETALVTSFYLVRRQLDTDYVWPLPFEGDRWTNVPGLDGRGTGLSLHPEDDRLAVVKQNLSAGGIVSRAGELAVLDARSYEPLLQRELTFRPWCVAYSPDGAFLAVGTHEGRVLLFETELHTVRLDFQAHDSYVYSIAWTPDGSRLVTASGDETIKIWDSRPRPASRLEYDRWVALRADMELRDDLREAYASLDGEERQAARVELMRRVQPPE